MRLARLILVAAGLALTGCPAPPALPGLPGPPSPPSPWPRIPDPWQQRGPAPQTAPPPPPPPSEPPPPGLPPR